jgi:hypothetical protein
MEKLVTTTGLLETAVSARAKRGLKQLKSLMARDAHHQTGETTVLRHREHPTCAIFIPSADVAGALRLQHQRTLPLCSSGGVGGRDTTNKKGGVRLGRSPRHSNKGDAPRF